MEAKLAVIYRESTDHRRISYIDVHSRTGGDPQILDLRKDNVACIAYDTTPDLGVIVVGSKGRTNGDSGRVKVFTCKNIAAYTHDEYTKARKSFGHRVQISDNGLLLVVSHFKGKIDENNTNVYVFTRTGREVMFEESESIHRGTNSDAEGEHGVYGDGLFINGPGTRLYVGESDRGSTTHNGHVFVYDITDISNPIELPAREITTAIHSNNVSEEFGGWYMWASNDGTSVLISENGPENKKATAFSTHLYTWNGTSYSNVDNWEDSTYVSSASETLDAWVAKSGGTSSRFGNYDVQYTFYPHNTPLGSCGGDPYIFPLHGPVVKLPNCDNFYRLLQIPSTQTVINAAVARATLEQRVAIRDQTTGLIDYADAIDDGYFLSEIFVSTVGRDITINLEPGSTVLSRTDLPWTEAGVRTGQNTTGLLQGTYQARNVQVGPVTLEVRIFGNAQIRNEVVVSLTGTHPADTSGLLYRNYRPNLFQLGSLTSMKTQTRYQKSCRPLTQKAPVNQYEHTNRLLVQQG